MGLIDIIGGHINELFDKNEELYESRMKICKECPLYKETPLGPICNPSLFINKDGEISQIKRDGYVRGCSCALKKKCNLPRAHCIVNK